MSQPPPPPGNPPQFGKSEGAVPPPPPQGPPQTPPPAGGYGYPAPGTPPPPGPGTPPPPPAGGQNPYAAPVPPGQNPYAAPTQPAFPQGQFSGPQAPPPPYPSGRQPPYPGAPQPPQPPQGYGHPAQGGYGQQTPPPYGYAPQQQPGGYPQQYQAAPAGRGSGRLVVIIAAAVAAVLVVGGGVWLATRGGDDPKPSPQADSGGTGGGTKTAKPPSNRAMSFKWDVAADPVAQKDNLKTVLGMWFTDKYVVKNEIDKVVAYDLTTGARQWTIPAPSSGDCTAARDASDGVTAIQYGAACEKVMAIDLNAGKALWTKTLPGGAGSKGDHDYSEMAVSNGVVGVDWLEGSIAWRLSDQKVMWQAGDGDCEDDGYAGGKQFVAVVNCDWTTYKVQLVDPANNGKPKWSWTAPAGTQVSAVVSTDPVVVLLGTESEPYTDVAVLAGGRMQSRVSLGTDKYDIDDDGTEQQAVHNVLVSSDTLYLSLRGQSDSKGQVLSGIVAFNLSDGKQKWVARPADKQDITGLDFVNGKVLAYEPADYDVQGKLVTIDPATGAISPFATFAKSDYEHLDTAALHAYPVWHGDRFYIVDKEIYASTHNQKYLVVFG